MSLVLAAVSADVVVPIVVALIAGVTAGLSPYFLQTSGWRREATDKATQTLNHFRDPLLRAAFDLQSRLYNIEARRFLDRYWTQGDEEQRNYARCSTLWLFGQYLGWVEILRREVQYLDLGTRAANQRLQRGLSEVSAALASDSQGQANHFVIFRSDQRAIGEFMVGERPSPSERPDCVGYTEFNRKLAELEGEADALSGAVDSSVVLTWAQRFTRDLEAEAVRTGSGEMSGRVVAIQRRLIDLLDLLDPDRLRYPHLNYRGRLPELGAGGPAPKLRTARFIWSWSDPWEEVEAWAAARRLKLAGDEGDRRQFRGHRGLLGRRLEVTVSYERSWLSVRAGRTRFRRPRALDGSLRARRSRRRVNDLLRRFDRPVLDGEATFPDRLVTRSVRLVRRLRATAGDHES